MLKVIHILLVFYIMMGIALLQLTDGKPAPVDSNETPAEFEESLPEPEAPQQQEEEIKSDGKTVAADTMGWDTWKAIDPIENGFLNEREFETSNVHYIGKRVLPVFQGFNFA